MKRTRVICIIIAIGFISSCMSLSPKQTAESIPENTIIHNNCKLVEFPISYDPNGFDKEQVENVLNSYLHPMIFSVEELDSEKTIEYSSDLRSLNMKLELNRFSTSSMRKYYLAEGSTGMTIPGFGDGKISYKSIFELNMTLLNPQYSIMYSIINPIEMLTLQLNSDDVNKDYYVIFTNKIYAPEMFYEHYLIEGDASFSAKTPIVFGNAKGMMSQTESRILSNSFTLRRFNDSEKFQNVFDVNEGMFKEIPKDEILKYDLFNSSSKRVISPKRLALEYEGTYYKLTTSYRNHLERENVQFLVIGITEEEKEISNTISNATGDQLVKWMSGDLQVSPEIKKIFDNIDPRTFTFQKGTYRNAIDPIDSDEIRTIPFNDIDLTIDVELLRKEAIKSLTEQ